MIRGIIVGMGKIAQTGHMPAYADPSLDGVIEIPAVVEPNPRSRALAAELYPLMKFYPTLDECLQAEHPDFVDISTPPYTHAGYIETVLQRGLHILCEKPFALTEPAARLLAAKLSNAPERVFMGCHQYRFSPVWKEFMEFRRSFTSADKFSLQFDVYRTEADPGLKIDSAIWRTDKLISGGGILADTGIHYLYLTYWLFGSPLAVTARTATLLYTGSAIEDTASVVLEYPNGIVRVNCTWAADRRMNSARFVLPTASLDYDGTLLVRYRGNDREEIPVPDAADKRTYIRMYADLFGEFAEQIQRKSSRREWITEAYESVRLLHACYDSAAQEKTIHLGPGYEHAE